MTHTTIAKNWVRRFIIAASAVGVASGAAMVITGCATRAVSQTSTPTVNCQGPGTITASSCTTPEGSWKYTVTIPASGGSPATLFQGVETYDTGGGYNEADELSVIPGYTATAGHGAWSATTGSGFLLTYQNLTYDPSTGNPSGYSRVRQTTTIDASGINYSGSGDFTYYDTTGAAVPGGAGTFTITATKVLVSQPGS